MNLHSKLLFCWIALHLLWETRGFRCTLQLTNQQRRCAVRATEKDLLFSLAGHEAGLKPQVKLRDVFGKALSKVLVNFDKDNEDSRKFRRTVFTNSDWKRHRSSNRYFRELTQVSEYGIVRGLVRQALIISSVSAVIVLYNILAEANRMLPVFTLPVLPFTLTFSSLGLLLVFRTNSAYSRWNEARTSWSQISARSFDVMRQCLAWLTDKETVAKTVRYLVAFSKTTKWHLTDRVNVRKLQDELSSILTDEEVNEIISSKMKPQFVLLCLTKLIARQSLIPNVQSHMDRGLIDLGGALETCEKIYSTPIPLAYTRITARFIMLWLLSFPFALYNEISMAKKWVIPVITFFTSLVLLGIDELGIQIEEPFSVLPLANICYNSQTTAQMTLQTGGVDWFQGTPQHQAAVSLAAAAAVANPSSPDYVLLTREGGGTG